MSQEQAMADALDDAKEQIAALEDQVETITLLFKGEQTQAQQLHAEVEQLREERQTKNQRMWDLLRHQRGELFNEELITPLEFAQLAEDHPAVKRLEDYDTLRQRCEALEALLQRAPIDHFRWCNGPTDCDCPSRGWIEERQLLLEGKPA